MKQIKMPDNIWEKLSRLKLDLKVKSLWKVIERLLKLVSKFKLKEELKELKGGKNGK